MKKKNPFLQGAVWLLVITMLGVCAMAGNTTSAYYTASATGNASAGVAKWSILVGGEDIVGVTDLTTLEIGLFETILCDGGTTDNNAKEQHVTEGLFAPGTKGSMAGLEVVNASDVTADVEVSIEWVYNDAPANAGIVTDLKTRFTLADIIVPLTTLDPGDKIEFEDTDCAWSWAWGTDSNGDTAIGKAAAALAGTASPLVKAVVTVTATQVN